MTSLHVVVLGLDRNCFREGSAAYLRMRAYAEQFTSFNLIVPAKKKQVTALGSSGLVHGAVAQTKLGQLIMMYWLAYRLIKNSPRPIIIMSQDAFELGLMAYILACYFKVGWNLQVHAEYINNPYWLKQHWLNPLRLQLARFLLPRATSVRVVRPGLRDLIMGWAKVDPKRIYVLPIIFNLPSVDETRPLKNHNQPFTFLVVSRLSQEKNISMIVRAFAEVNSRYPLTQLKIIGAGPEKNNLLELSRQSKLKDRIIFHDWTDEPLRFLAAGDALIVSSYAEGWGMSIIEALAVSCPVITTNVGVAKDYLTDGREALIVPVANEPALITAMEKLIIDPALREQLSAEGRAWLASLPTTEEYLRQYGAMAEATIT